MADVKGDKTKQPPECNDGSLSCPNLKEVGGGMEGERYRCDVCGERFFLDYEDMK
jgi:transposase-like protein